MFLTLWLGRIDEVELKGLNKVGWVRLGRNYVYNYNDISPIPLTEYDCKQKAVH